MTNVDVAVVGAGLAGLCAARRLAQSGLSISVLEARDRVGGRTWSRTLADGTVLDLGGQWIGPMQTRVVALARELGVESFPTYNDGETLRFLSGDPQEVLQNLVLLFQKLEAMAEQIPLERPWTAAYAREWDAQTFQTWLLANVSGPDTLTLARLVATALFTVEADELSLLHVLVYIRSADSMSNLTNVIGGAQELRFVKGAQELSLCLAAQLGKDCVRLSSPVRCIRQTSQLVTVEADGGSVEARHAIIAAPAALADRIVYAPALPGYRSHMHQRIAPGEVIKIHCVYERPFWRARGLNGRVMSGTGPVTVTFDNSPACGSVGILVAFVEADEVRLFRRLAAAERRKAAIDCLVRFFGPDAAEPREYVETDWSEEEWTRGCYGGNFPPGGWTRYGAALREPFARLHWAGTETSAVWMNYMEGAIRSGERAAEEVIAAMR